eukprot:UN24485
MNLRQFHKQHHARMDTLESDDSHSTGGFFCRHCHKNDLLRTQYEYEEKKRLMMVQLQHSSSMVFGTDSIVIGTKPSEKDHEPSHSRPPEHFMASRSRSTVDIPAIPRASSHTVESSRLTAENLRYHRKASKERELREYNRRTPSPGATKKVIDNPSSREHIKN